jgi:hypothetical protein
MDGLTAFGLFDGTSVVTVLGSYLSGGTASILAFAGSCSLGCAYGFLQGAWPFGLVEAIWALVALRRWQNSRSRSSFYN